MEKRYTIDLDIYAKQKLSTNINFVSGDTNVNILDINLKSQNQSVDLTEVDAVTITFRKPDKNVVIGTCEVLDPIRGKVSFVLGTQEIAYPGVVQAEIQLFKDAKRLTSALFEFTVRRELDSGDWQESETYLPILTELQKGMHDTRVTNFIIAPYNAVNKERADLVLTGVPADDLAAINQAITDLHTARASVDVAIRIDFLGGNVDVGTKSDGSAIVIPVGYDNIHLYGNGVKITGEVQDISGANAYSVLDSSGNNCILDGFDIDNSSGDYGLYNTGTNCTVSGNTCIGGGYATGLYNTGTNCTVSGNTCIGYYGLYNTGTNCTVSGNTCIGGGSGGGSGEYGLYCGASDTTNKCIIIGNVCLEGGISVEEGTCLPATQEAMADVNTGVITLRS